jgi:hypothetical protein
MSMTDEPDADLAAMRLRDALAQLPEEYSEARRHIREALQYVEEVGD